MNKKLVIGFGIALIALAAVGYSYKTAHDSKQGVYTLGSPEREVFYESTYKNYMELNNYTGKMAKGEVPIDVYSYIAGDGANVITEADGVITPEEGTVTWEFEVKEAGFYNLEFGYIPVDGTNSRIERKLYLDGESHFKGMEQIGFDREWINESDTIEVRRDNEVRPNTVELVTPKTVFVEDSQKRMPEAYKFYLSPGKHTLTLESVKEPMKVTSLTFKAEQEVVSYEEMLNQNKDSYPLYGGEVLVGQAERIDGITKQIVKSTRSILMNSNYSSSKLEPAHPYNLVFNTIGGDSWKTPGDQITWEVEVPEKGLYQLAFVGRQNVNRGGVSYRKLLVNGEVPFEEANSIGFPYSGEFENYIIGNEEGAFLIPLEAGVNTITLDTVLGQYDRAVTEVEESLFILNETYRKIVQLTGTVPDGYIDYEIDKKLPEVKGIFAREAERLMGILDEVVGITGQKGQEVVVLEKLGIQLTELAEDPNKVVKQLDQLKNNVASLGTWNMEIGSMPLEIDAITLAQQGSDLIETKANLLESTAHETLRFLSTFFVDNTSVAGEAEKGQESIKVWIGTGRDQAQVLMGLIEESFTPMTDINVQLELIPQGVIIPATLAGTGPDVVIGLSESQAMNFAVRNALVDVSELPGFDKEYERYFPSAFEGVTYQGEVFGLPEQQSFMMMFYREDILEELGVEIPRTWEDVKSIIPALQAQNYDFYMPTPTATTLLNGGAIYPSLVFQNGGDMYLGEGNDYGIQSGLYSNEAMKSFQELTQFFTSYHLPVVADFSNRFRTGEVPIGITSYATYSQLQVFAPEIRGLWSFVPIPGTMQPDGTIDNTFVSSTVQCVMLDNAKNKDASWEFMKWWTSEEVQLQYATTIEGIMGPAARYAAADVKVLEQLPWSVSDAKNLKQQFEATKGIPEVPGGYMTARMIDYAFKNVVTDGQNPREALYLNTKTIDDELTKKRKEFGLSIVEE